MPIALQLGHADALDFDAEYAREHELFRQASSGHEPAEEAVRTLLIRQLERHVPEESAPVLLSALTEPKTPEQLEEAWQAWVVDKAAAPALSGKPALAAAFKDLLNEAAIRAAYTPPTTPKFIAEHNIEHTIDTGGAQPVSAPFRRTPQLHVDFIRTTIQELLDAGVIRRSKSPWSAPVVVAAKPNGGLRFCAWTIASSIRSR